MRTTTIHPLLTTLLTTGALAAQDLPPRIDPFTRYLESTVLARPMDPLAHRGRPLAFVENRGQWDRRARFMAQDGDATAWIEECGFVVDLSAATSAERRGVVLALRFSSTLASGPSAAPARVEGSTRLAGARHYLRGADPSRWQRDVPAFAEVLASDVLPGVDVRYRDERGLLRFDLELDEARFAADLAIDVEGATSLATLPDGRLRLATDFQDVLLSRPVAWQVDRRGDRRPVEVAFRLLGASRLAFSLGAHEADQPLVIDPWIHWATYCGGTADEQIVAVARTQGSTVTLAGRTASTNYPTSAGAYRTANGGGAWDGVVTKLDPSKLGPAQLVFSTYLGGGGDDAVLAMLEDGKTGNLWLAGMSDSVNHPTTANAWSTTNRGRLDATIAALDASGKTLVYGSYYGGVVDEWANAITFDATGQPMVAGYTESPGLPAVQAYQPGYGGERDAFWVRLAPGATSTAVVQSSYFGGPHLEGDKVSSLWNWTDLDIHLDGSMLTIVTQSRGGMPTTTGSYLPAFPTQLQTAVNTHLARLDLSQTGSAQLLKATWFGGPTPGVWTTAYGMRVLPDGRVVLGGISYDPKCPTTPGAYVTAADAAIGPATNHDAFFAILSADLAKLDYATLLGGTASVGGGNFTVERSGAIVAGGYTFSALAPTPGAPVATRPGGPTDLYLLRLLPEGKGKDDLRFLSYSGGTGGESIFALAGDEQGGAVVAGVAASTDFPVTSGAFQPARAGPPRDAMVAHFDLQPLGFERLGRSQGTCSPGRFLGLVFDASRGRGTCRIAVTGGLPQDWGFLALGSESSPPIPVLGVDAWVLPVLVVPYQGDATGSAEVTIPIPSSVAIDTKLAAQAFLVFGKGCSMLESSNGGRITIRP